MPLATTHATTNHLDSTPPPTTTTVVNCTCSAWAEEAAAKLCVSGWAVLQLNASDAADVRAPLYPTRRLLDSVVQAHKETKAKTKWALAPTSGECMYAADVQQAAFVDVKQHATPDRCQLRHQYTPPSSNQHQETIGQCRAPDCTSDCDHTHPDHVRAARYPYAHPVHAVLDRAHKTLQQVAWSVLQACEAAAPVPGMLRSSHYSKESTVMDIFLYPGLGVGPEHTQQQKVDGVATPPPAQIASTSTPPSASPPPPAATAALPSHVDPGLVTIVADDRPGLEVWCQQQQKWIGPILLASNQVVIITNRELEKLTVGDHDGGSSNGEAGGGSGGVGFVACLHRVAAATTIEAAASASASASLLETGSTNGSDNGMSSSSSSSRSGCCSRRTDATPSRLSVVMEVRTTASGAYAASQAAKKRLLAKPAQDGVASIDKLLLMGGNDVPFFSSFCKGTTLLFFASIAVATFFGRGVRNAILEDGLNVPPHLHY